MRGTRDDTIIDYPGPGIIPAYAGNTFGVLSSAVTFGDHPRVCGEHLTMARLPSKVLGSSPRMRGTLRSGIRRNVVNGIIPAYAGNTLPPPPRTVAAWDHPRVCGEHIGLTVMAQNEPGSSPRMRGTLQGSVDTLELFGIIPAYAGNTFVVSLTVSPPRDHPRVCGEHRSRPCTSNQAQGSSPRMRGTRVQWFQGGHYLGIIPAYAGNTCVLCLVTYLYWDHPRVCGEHIVFCSEKVVNLGSSPRMRGTPQDYVSRYGHRGIIPAYAGNTDHR